MVSLNLGLDKFAPRSLFQFGSRVTKNAVWADDPLTQIVTNIVIIAGLMLSASVGFLVGVPLALLALGFLSIGVVRLAYRYIAG